LKKKRPPKITVPTRVLWGRHDPILKVDWADVLDQHFAEVEVSFAAFSARRGRNEQVLQIANRAKAPSVGVKNIVGEPDVPSFWADREQRTDWRARRKDTLPEALSGLIRNTTIEFRAVSSPEAEPILRIGGLRRANFYHSQQNPSRTLALLKIRLQLTSPLVFHRDLLDKPNGWNASLLPHPDGVALSPN
jgi:hypothetical protein